MAFTVVASDGFSGAGSIAGAMDGAGGGSGSWTISTGSWTKAAGRCVCPGTGRVTGGTTSSAAAQRASVKQVNADFSGPLVAWTDANNFIVAWVAGATLLIYEIVAGSATLIATRGTVNATQTFGLSTNGTVVQAWIDGVADGATVTPTAPAVGGWGMAANNGGSLDDFTYEEEAGGGGSSIKTINGLANASVKTVNGLARASVKTVNGLA